MFCVPSDNGQPDSFAVSLRNQLPDDRHELDRHFHHGVRDCLVRSLILGNGFRVGLRLVVLENASDTLLVPANGIP